MNQEKTTRSTNESTKRHTRGPVKALGLCSGGLDSILSALVLKKQGIEVTWISFETPFFSAESARKASRQTQIDLIVQDITTEYMEMLKAPRAGFGKNMNPCMDCHTMMFAKAGALSREMGFDFLFSGEVLGQRPKSQTRNSLRYVEKNSGFDGSILRPLSALCLPETPMEACGLVDRKQLMDITGRSRKVQMQMARQFGIKEFPSPAGGCLLTDPGFSNRLRELMFDRGITETRQLHLLKHGRHFNLDLPGNPHKRCKLIVGRSKGDNKQIMAHYNPKADLLLRHDSLPGPDALLVGNFDQEQIETAAAILAAYTKAVPGEPSRVKLVRDPAEQLISIITRPSSDFKERMI